MSHRSSKHSQSKGTTSSSSVLKPAPGGKTPHKAIRKARTGKQNTKTATKKGSSGQNNKGSSSTTSTTGGNALDLSIDGEAVRKPVVGGFTNDNDHNNKQVLGDTKLSLPPLVQGEIEGSLSLTVNQVFWTSTDHPKSVVVRAKWWGERGHGVLFKPMDAISGLQEGTQFDVEENRVRYLVRCGYDQIVSYLKDMKTLVLDVVDSSNSKIVGTARVPVLQVDVNSPLDAYLPITRKLGNSSIQLGELNVHINLSMVKDVLNRNKAGTKSNTLSTTSQNPDVTSSFVLNEQQAKTDDNLPILPSPELKNGQFRVLKNQQNESGNVDVDVDVEGEEDETLNHEYHHEDFATPEKQSTTESSGDGSPTYSTKSIGSQRSHRSRTNSPHSTSTQSQSGHASKSNHQDADFFDSISRHNPNNGVPNPIPSREPETDPALSKVFSQSELNERSEMQDSIDRLLARANTLKQEMTDFSATATEYDQESDSTAKGPDGFPMRASLGAISLVEHDGVVLSGSDDQLLNQLFFAERPKEPEMEKHERKQHTPKTHKTKAHKTPKKEMASPSVNDTSDIADDFIEVDTKRSMGKTKKSKTKKGKSKSKGTKSTKASQEIDVESPARTRSPVAARVSTSMEDGEVFRPISIYLQVTEALDVPEPFNGMRSMYVACNMLAKDKRVTSATVNNNNCPRFNFFSQARLQGDLSAIQDESMVVQLWDSAGGANDELIGVVVLKLHALIGMFIGNQMQSSLARQYPVIGVHADCPVFNPTTQRIQGYLRLLLAMGTDRQIYTLQQHQKASVVLQRGYRGHLKRRGIASLPRKQRKQHQVAPEHDSVLMASLDLQSMQEVASERTDPSEVASSHASTVAVEEEAAEPEQPAPVVAIKVVHCDQVVTADDESSSSSSSSSSSAPTFGVCASFAFPETAVSNITKILPVNGRSNTMIDLEAPEWHQHRIETPEMLMWKKPMQFDVWRCGVEINGPMKTNPVLLGTVGQAFLAPNQFEEFWSLDNEEDQHDGSIERMFQLPVMQTTSSGKSVRWGSITVSVKMFHAELIDQLLQQYEQSKEARAQQEMEDDVGSIYRRTSMTVNVSRASGLQSAAMSLTPTYPFLRLASKFGVNAYVTIEVLNDDDQDHQTGGKELKTDVVARSFAPIFDFQQDLNLLLTDSVLHHLQHGFAVFRIWHRIPRGTSELSSGASRPDVLLGLVKVPLCKLLQRESGIHGWFDMRSPLGDSVASLELSVCFSTPNSRQHAVQLQQERTSMNEVPQMTLRAEQEKMTFTVVVQEMNVPVSNGNQHSGTPGKWFYVTYRFPGCETIRSVPIAFEGRSSRINLKHRCALIVDVDTQLEWNIREEPLEVQIWRSRTYDFSEAGQYVGSAFVDMHPLLGDRDGHEGDESNWVGGDCAVIHPESEQHLQTTIGVQIVKQHGAVRSARTPSVVSHSSSVVSNEPTAPSVNRSANDSHNDSQSSAESERSHVSIVEPVTRTRSQSHVSHEDKMQQTSFEDQVSVIESEHGNTLDYEFAAGMSFMGVGGSDEDKRNAVHLEILEGMHLPLQVSAHNRDILEKPNAFVSVKWNSNGLLETEVANGTVKPQWQFGHSFPVNMDGFFWSYIKDGALVFKVYHRVEGGENDGANEFIGSARVPLFPMLRGIAIDGWYSLFDYKHAEAGLIRVRVAMDKSLMPLYRKMSDSEEHGYDVKAFSDAEITTPGLSSSTGRKVSRKRTEEGMGMRWQPFVDDLGDSGVVEEGGMSLMDTLERNLAALESMVKSGKVEKRQPLEDRTNRGEREPREEMGTMGAVGAMPDSLHEMITKEAMAQLAASIKEATARVEGGEMMGEKGMGKGKSPRKTPKSPRTPRTPRTSKKAESVTSIVSPRTPREVVVVEEVVEEEDEDVEEEVVEEEVVEEEVEGEVAEEEDELVEVDQRTRIEEEAKAMMEKAKDEVEGEERGKVDEWLDEDSDDDDDDDDEEFVDPRARGWKKSPASASEYVEETGGNDRGYPDKEQMSGRGGATMSALERAKRFQVSSRLTQSEAYMRAVRQTSGVYDKEAKRIEEIFSS